MLTNLKKSIFSLGLVVGILTLPTVVTVGQEKGNEKSEETLVIKDKIGNELIERQYTEELADDLAKKASIAYEKGEYEKAVALYLESIQYLRKCSKTSAYVKSKIGVCNQAISKAYYFWSVELSDEAEKLAEAKKYDEAIKLCAQVLQIFHFLFLDQQLPQLAM